MALEFRKDIWGTDVDLGLISLQMVSGTWERVRAHRAVILRINHASESLG